LPRFGNEYDNGVYHICKEDDPFYSPANIAYLEGIVADMKSGKAKFEEHDLIEVDE